MFGLISVESDFIQSGLLRRAVAGATLVLIAVTLPLWDSRALFPDIPWLSVLVAVPPQFDPILVGVLGLLCVAGVMLSQRWLPGRLFWGGYLVLLSALVLLDQNRMQAWVVEFLIIALTGVICSNAQFIKTLRWLPVSVYFYSALSKFDAAFLMQAGQNLMCELFQIDPRLTPGWVGFAVWLLPVGELLIVGMLIRTATRQWGLMLSIAMHVTIILALGPWGLQHEWGVVLWNVYFILQNAVLYAKLPGDSETRIRLSLFQSGWVVLLVTYPALAWVGACDPWPAWVVYSERPVRVVPLVHVGAIHLLSPSVRASVGDPFPLSDWAPVNLDAQSFRELHCPLNPAARYRGGVWLAEARELPADQLAIRVDGPPDRWTGVSPRVEIKGREALQQWINQRWCNTRPR